MSRTTVLFVLLAGAEAARVSTVPRRDLTSSQQEQQASLVQLKHELPDLLDSSDGLETLWGVKLTQTSDAAEEERQRTLLNAFLASANGDAAAARRKLEQTIQWRRTLADRPSDGFGILPTDLLLQAGPSAQPTLVLDISKLPAEAFSDSAKLVQWWVAMQDAIYARVLASGSLRFNFVVDCSGLRKHHFGKAARLCAAHLAPVLNEHYPDHIAGETIIINSPVWFKAAYVVLQPILPRSFVKSLRISRMHNVGPCIELTPADQSSGRADGANGAAPSMEMLRKQWLELAGRCGDGLSGARQRLDRAAAAA